MNFPPKFFGTDSIQNMAIKRSTKVYEDSRRDALRRGSSWVCLVSGVGYSVKAAWCGYRESPAFMWRSRYSSRLRGPFHKAVTLPLKRGLVYRLAPKAVLFRGMLTEFEVFLGKPGVFGLRPCTQTRLKRPCDVLARFVGRVTNTVNTGDYY